MNKISEIIRSEIFDQKKDDTSIEADWTKYYIDSLLISLEKFAVVLVSALITKKLKLACLTYIIFSMLRKYARGWHALNSFYCTIQSVLFYVLFPIFFESYRNSLVWYISLGLLLIILLILFAPQGTLRNPISFMEVTNLKKQIFIRANILFIFMIFLKVFRLDVLANIILYCMILQVFLILPITQKLIEGSLFNVKKN